jgi:hypothetical protein
LIGFAIAIAASASTLAQSPPIQVSVDEELWSDCNFGDRRPECIFGPTPSVTRTRAVEFRFSARNFGTVPYDTVLVRFRIDDEEVQPSTLAVQAGGDCSLQIPSADIYQWQIERILPGQLRNCSLTLRTRPSGARVAGGGSLLATIPSDLVSSFRAIRYFTYASFDVVRDMTLRAAMRPGLLPPGAVTTVDFTLTNNGPDSYLPPENTSDSAGSTEQFLFLNDGGGERFRFGTLAVLGQPDDPDCLLFRDGPSGPTGSLGPYQILYRPVPAGASTTCTLALAALDGAVGRRDLRFFVPWKGPGIFDPDLSNNFADVRLQFTPDIVPANTRGGLAILIALVVALGLFALRFGRTTH